MASAPPPTSAQVTPYRELTVVSVILGVLIGAVMTAAFTYVALKLGFTLPGSTVAAILGFAVLRGILRKGSIVENNINQTVASGVNNASAGVAFTLPALFLLGENFEVLPVILAAVGGSFLGIVIIIPLRKQLIEFERLKFPSGIAVATLLKSPGAGMQQAVLLGGGFLVGAFFHVLAGFGVIPEEVSLNHLLGVPEYIPLAFGISFASLGAGLLSGRGGLPFVFGGMLAWWLIAPIAVITGMVPSPTEAQLATEAGAASYESWVTWGVLYSQLLRPVGIGILIGGAISGVIASFPALKSAIGSLAQAAKTQGPGGSDEMPPTVLYAGIIGSIVVLFLAAFLSDSTIGAPRALLVAIVGTIWLGFAGLIVAQAAGRTDISPISGMSLIGVTLMFFLSGGNVVASITLGIAVAIGIGQCGDMMSDLKSGHLIGATPRLQQLAQFSVAWVGVPVAVGVIYLLWGPDGGGFGPGNPELTAPQGQALAAIVESLANGNTPLDKYGAGAAIGLGLGLFPISGVGVLVGLAMYLPFYITVTYGIGCLGNMVLLKAKGQRWIGTDLVPIAAGFIIGEALTSLSVVIIKLVAGA